jgi:hypothetical protein
VALHHDQVEYDVTFPTNDLGFIDYEDYREGAAEGLLGTAIVGDSFTAGFHGGNPWVPRMRDRARANDPDVQVYNLGVTATGLGAFRGLLHSVDQELDFDRIAVVMITDDVGRRRWAPVENDGKLVMCPDSLPRSQCEAMPSRLLILEDDSAPLGALFERVRREGLIEDPTSVGEFLERKTFLGFRWRALRRSQGETPQRWSAAATDRRVRKWLSRMVADFPDTPMILIQLPDMGEVQQTRLDVDVSETVRGAGLEYVSLLDVCDLEPSDYFGYDDHPRASGYDKIGSCVGHALGLF